MAKRIGSYVVRVPQGSWRITGTRVSLDSVVHAYLEGKSPESILEDFPSLTLEKIHGAIAFYLHNRAKIDVYLCAQSKEWEKLRLQSEAAHQTLLNRIRARRQAFGRGVTA